MSALEVREATNGVEWNAFVDQVEGGSTFHRWEWRDFYRDIYGHQTPYLAAYRAGAIAGVLPLVRVKSLVFGHYLVSLPYVSYGGPLGEPDAQRALSAHAASIAKGAKLVELRSRAPIDTELTLVSRKITVVRDLVPGDYEATFKTFDSKVRSQVRRAEREGLSVRFGHELLPAYHRVFAEHMRDLGSPAHGLEFFTHLARALGDRAWVGVAFLGDEPVAAGFAIENAHEVEISWASALRKHSKIAPNMALYGAFIRRACELGFAAFNFGRCTVDSGTHKFKRQWGSRDEPLAWYQYAPGGGVSAPPNPDQGAYGTAVKVWQKLPLSVTTPLGARLIAGIP
jgi:FemAB-related protein (PEP-CTERM system-associated)